MADTDFPVLNFQDFITADGDRLTTDSRKVAAVFGKRHDDVLKKIKALLDLLPEDDRLRNFALVTETMTYRDASGAVVTKATSRVTRCVMTKDGFTLLAMGFTGKKALQFKLAYIEAFNTMAAFLKNQRDGLGRSERGRVWRGRPQAHQLLDRRDDPVVQQVQRAR